MAPDTQTTFDIYREALEKELESVVLPEVKDLKTASMEAVIRDMHRVLAGNGGVARGIVYKVASANAHVKCLDNQLAGTRSDLNAHLAYCQKITAEGGHVSRSDILAEAVRTTESNIDDAIAARIAKFMTRHKATIGFIILLFLQTLTGIHLANMPAGTARTPELDAKITKLVSILREAEIVIRENKAPDTAPITINR